MCVMQRFSVVRSLAASFFERSGQVPARRHGGLSVDFLIGELTKKSCFLFGVVFAIPRYKSKASKRDIGENCLQTMQYRLQITTAKRLQVMQRIDCNKQLVVQRNNRTTRQLLLQSFSLDKIKACIRSLAVSSSRDNRAKTTHRQRARKLPVTWKRGLCMMSRRCERATRLYLF